MFICVTVCMYTQTDICMYIWKRERERMIEAYFYHKLYIRFILGHLISYQGILDDMYHFYGTHKLSPLN